MDRRVQTHECLRSMAAHYRSDAVRHYRATVASSSHLHSVYLLILFCARRHPCNGKPSAIADITLRLSEGIQELKLEQQLAPTREAISRTITAGSTNFFKAVEGVKGR